MPNPRAIRRKLNKKVIRRLGLDTVYLRKAAATEVDMYGEPIGTANPFDEFPIRIVIDKDKRDNEASQIGGLPDDKKEFICIIASGDIDLRSGDIIIYPAASKHRWIVDMVEPIMMNDIPVILEAKAYKDARY